MKILLLVLLFAVSVSAQDIKEIEKIKDWKLLAELSGDVPDHPGITIETRAARIARGDSVVKLVIRFDFPFGAPTKIFRDAATRGFDVSSVVRLIGRVDLNCATLAVTPARGEGYIYQFNGRRHKTKEPSFSLPSGHILEQYFCERGDAPTKAPTLKPKP